MPNSEKSDGELEEGEITEDSSDDNNSFEASARPIQATRGGSCSVIVTGDSNEVADSGKPDQTDYPDSMDRALEECSLLPESILSLEPDADCLAYM